MLLSVGFITTVPNGKVITFGQASCVLLEDITCKWMPLTGTHCNVYLYCGNLPVDGSNVPYYYKISFQTIGYKSVLKRDKNFEKQNTQLKKMKEYQEETKKKKEKYSRTYKT